MQHSRLLLVVVGVGALLAALAVSVPDVSGVVAAVGSDYFLVAGVAVVGLLLAAGRFHSGRTSAIEQATMPEPERPVSVRPLGARFDRALSDRRLGLPVVGDSPRERLHAELRATALRTVCRVGHCDLGSAADHLARGDWTDDADAAAFLAAEEPPESSLATAVADLFRSVDLVGGDPWFRAQATNAAEAIVAAATEAEMAVRNGRNGSLPGGNER